MIKESAYQAKLIKKIKCRFKDCVVLKNDANYIQGFPDLMILYKDKWACLECKRSASSHHQPNQDFYVSKLNNMSYAAFIYPENEEEILNAMEQSFKSS
jgi:hypothetical protein